MKTLEQIAIECGAEIIRGQEQEGWENPVYDLEPEFVFTYTQLQAFAKTMLESAPAQESEPVRIELGHGKYGIHYGTLEGVPCLNISDKGVGIVGTPTTHENLTELEREHEIVTITFLNKESYDVFKNTVDSIPYFKVESEPIAQSSEAVAWQFFQDGKWHTGSETRNHKKNTIDSGYPVRDLFTSPQPIAQNSEPVALMDRVGVCAITLHMVKELESRGSDFPYHLWPIKLFTSPQSSQDAYIERLEDAL